nr:peptidoglycan DD-metalloendopeptidase family protein [uncultured Oscillibacter sp.]
MRKRIARRILRPALCLFLAVLCLAADLTPATARVSQEDIDALKGDAADLKDRRKELEAQLKTLANDKSTAIQRKNILDQQIANTTSQIANVEQQIAQYDQLIAQKEEELRQAEAEEAEQYALFCRRVRAMEEQGTISYWSVLFKADSFTDLLSRMDFINEIMEADQRVIDDLKALQVQIDEAKTSLEGSRTEAQAARDELAAKKKELDTQRAEANKVIQQIAAAEEETEATLDEMEAEQKKIQQEIERLNRELQAQLAAEGKSSQSNPGGYIWPVNSRYITSTMGGRSSPGGIGSTNHQGTDIGRVGYTSPIYAAKAGTVIVSQRSSSYGEYVVISHGSGNTTLYGHMSSRKVSVGQYVNQGDVIGITGSTGNSTGPHLHFEVVENGVRVNPLSSHGAEPRMGYLTGYTLSGSA